MEDWIHGRLSELLQFPVPEDLVKYILSIESSKDLEEYLKTLLNFENPKHRAFQSELLQKKNQTDKAKKKKPKQNLLSLSQEPAAAPEQVENPAGKKKQKFVNLYSQEGKNKEIVLLKGRHLCDCQASKHKLINNCIQCGRIICMQEGSGPCLFCGNLVCSAEEQAILNCSTKKSSVLYNRLMEQKRPQGWEAAVAQRNRLLEYDRTSERRTRVTDDDSDYFSSASVWLSKAERDKLDKYQQALREKKHASRLQQTFTLDFAGRQLVEENNCGGEVNEEVLREITEGFKAQDLSNSSKASDNEIYDGDIHPGFNGPAPKFDESIKSLLVAKAGRQPAELIQRVQDASLQEMGDRGACLSMHQPWASLLVLGIKIHEGRSWYTSHRGRLWIASTAQPADQDTIQSVENMYRVLYPDEKITFPKMYPSGCLLGCVNVSDCLSQEDYRQKFPAGESESPFVLICSEPRDLSLRFPISGKHKIYLLDQKIHQAAVKCLQKMAKIEGSI